MYSTIPGLILGFHGCDQSVADKVLNGKTFLENSENNYDWLGHGIYFWENSPSRALEFAQHLKNNPQQSNRPIKKPAVIGAIINVGFCLDLLDYKNLQLLKEGYEVLKSSGFAAEIRQNKAVSGTKDLLLRYLDCAVIETLHTVRKISKEQPFDSVRGVFWEGNKLYDTAGFREKNHIQICIRNPNCIKGFFLPRQLDKRFVKV
ncbi:MAG: hypothetical protein RIQ33_2293 [Bacteroidota bacterium]|jgi:hypothetical protein